MLEFNLSVNEQKFNALQGKELKSNLKKMLQAMNGVNKSQWQYAIALHNIIVNEYFKPDFKSQNEFASAIGIDKGTISKYVGAVRVMVNVLTPKFHYSIEQVPYSKASCLASIKDVEKFLKDTGIDLLKCTMRELEQAKRDYNKPVETVEPKQETEQTEQTEQEEKELPTFTGRYDDNEVWFTVNNIKYIIPMSELKHYKVK